MMIHSYIYSSKYNTKTLSFDDSSKNLLSPKSPKAMGQCNTVLVDNKRQMNELQVPDTFTAKPMSELNSSNAAAAGGGDQHFSQAFTDHCDQYKSVTSKILGNRKNKIGDQSPCVDIEGIGIFALFQTII